jgi:hypothetical protein
MSENDFVEQKIISAVQGILTGRVNEMLGEAEYQIPVIEFTDYRGESVVVPVISFSSCERTEKERIIKQDAYSLTITFSIPETRESELYCYAYSGTVSRAIYDDPTLGGVVERAVVTGKKYIPPKMPHCGENWELIISIRITVEGINES